MNLKYQSQIIFFLFIDELNGKNDNFVPRYDINNKLFFKDEYVPC